MSLCFQSSFSGPVTTLSLRPFTALRSDARLVWALVKRGDRRQPNRIHGHNQPDRCVHGPANHCGQGRSCESPTLRRSKRASELQFPAPRLNLVAKCIEAAVRCSESRWYASHQVESKLRGVSALEQTRRRTGIQARNKVNGFLAGPQYDRHGDTRLVPSIRMGMSK